MDVIRPAPGDYSRKEKTSLRMAALSLGIKRVPGSKRIRGLFP